MKIGAHDKINGLRAGQVVKKVLVNGIDVAKKCFYVDDELGEAHVFKVNQAGNFYCDNLGNIAKEILKGSVEIVLGGDSDS